MAVKRADKLLYLCGASLAKAIYSILQNQETVQERQRQPIDYDQSLKSLTALSAPHHEMCFFLYLQCPCWPQRHRWLQITHCYYTGGNLYTCPVFYPYHNGFQCIQMPELLTATQCPWCHLGGNYDRRFIRMVDELSIEYDWPNSRCGCVVM